MDVLRPVQGSELYIVPLLFGNLANWLLYGALTVQLYLYYIAFPNDRKWVKAVVFTAYGLETIQIIGLAIVLAITLETLLASSSATGHHLSPSLYELQARLIQLGGGLLPLISQFVYAYRIKKITHMKVVPWVIVVLAVLQLIASFLCSFYRPIPMFVWIGINVLNDTIIAVTLIRSLKQATLLTRETRNKVKRVICLIIGTGSITVAVDLVVFILSISAPNTGAFLTLIIFIPMLYANSILVMLNNRMNIGSSGKSSICECGNGIVTTILIANTGEDSNISLSQNGEA